MAQRMIRIAVIVVSPFYSLRLYIAKELPQILSPPVVGKGSRGGLQCNRAVAAPALKAEAVALVVLAALEEIRRLRRDMLGQQDECDVGVAVVRAGLRPGDAALPCESVQLLDILECQRFRRVEEYVLVGFRLGELRALDQNILFIVGVEDGLRREGRLHILGLYGVVALIGF